MNPIQQAISALEDLLTSEDFAQAERYAREVLTSLRSLQKEVEGVELPEVTQDDRRFLTDNPNTADVLTWMQDYARTAIAAALGRERVNSEAWKNAAQNALELARSFTPKAAQPTQAEAPSEVEADDDERLKPCPFCGSDAEVGEVPQGHEDAGGMFVCCKNSSCGASSALIFPLMDDVQRLLLERWNRRAALATQQAVQGEPVLTDDNEGSWKVLPERLRGRGDWLNARGRIKDAELMFDAATEIEGLRAALTSATKEQQK